MGALGKIASGFIKQVAPSIIKAVAPAATKLLGKITDGFVSKGADFLKTALGKLSLPSPLTSLLGGLIGKGAEKLKELGGGLIEKGLAKLTELVTTRFAPGAGNVSVPGMASPERGAALAANNPSAAPSAPSTGSSSSAATANTSGGGISGGPTGSSSAPNTPPDMPTNWEDRAQVEKYQRGMQAFQAAMQGMQAYFTMMSNIIKSQGDTAKQVIGNLR
jgi:hypothetical protein